MDEILLGSENRHFVNHSKTFLVSHSFSDEEHKQEVNNSIHKGSHFSNGIKFFCTFKKNYSSRWSWLFQ